MKFNFKIQKYQTLPVDSLVKCFEGHQFADKVQYRCDKGDEKESKLDFEENGYRNAKICLSEKGLLENIHKIQDENFIIHSDKIERTVGVSSFDIEMETGTGKTYDRIQQKEQIYVY